MIRKARLEDSLSIAKCLFLAMDEIIFQFIGQKNETVALAFLEHFAQSVNNQYSYQNCIVVELDGKVVAAMNSYDGAKLFELKQPIADYIKTQYKIPFDVENETAAGEWYIDSIGVLPESRGLGIGTQLLQLAIKEYVILSHKTLGLLVETNNPKAKKLYLKLGFRKVGMKKLVGKELEHLQLFPNPISS